ncbi:Cytochrome c oxidase assembly protein COX19, partial [Tolypocladium capitatum]
RRHVSHRLPNHPRQLASRLRRRSRERIRDEHLARPGASIKDMSTFGSPGKLPSTRPTPPQRGSFPLDHDGECRHVMTNYLACMKKVRGLNDGECRDLAKAYLACRMDRNLMAKDEFKNLGFAETPTKPIHESGPEKGVKGELRW